jgi:phosphatidylinositol alpha-1,6-mannosyltransferase
MARVLAEEVGVRPRPVSGMTLADRDAKLGLTLPVTPARGSRLRFVAGVLRAAGTCRHFMFDGCHLAQVQQLPLLRKKPVLTYLHGIEVWEEAPPRYLRSARRATLAVANSAFTRDKAEQLHGGFARARVCWLATESDEPAPPALCLASRPPEVLVVARLGERPKGHEELITCWPRVAAAVPGATLRVVGTGPRAGQLRRLAAESPVGRQIVFEGFVPDAELDLFYGRATVFAMPSRGEGFGLVYIEAMRHGLPVIAADEDAGPEIVTHGETGYTISRQRPQELADVLIHLLRNRTEAMRLGEGGRRRWAEQFRYSAFRARFLPLLREFLNL